MAIKKFFIEGDSTVKNVGLRPAIYGEACNYGVQVYPINLPKQNKIEIIVKGDEDNIKEFWEAVKSKDIRTLINPHNEIYVVTELEDYISEVEPDWTYFVSALTLEQVSKGTHFLKGIDNGIKELPKEIAKALREEDK